MDNSNLVEEALQELLNRLEDLIGDTKESGRGGIDELEEAYEHITDAYELIWEYKNSSSMERIL